MPSVAHIIRRRHNRKRRRRRVKRGAAFRGFLFFGVPALFCMSLALASLVLALWLYISGASHLPAPHETVLPRSEERATRFYDASGATLLHSLAQAPGDKTRWLEHAELNENLLLTSRLAESRGDGEIDAAFEPLTTLARLWRYIAGQPEAPAQDMVARLVRDAVLPLERSGALDRRLLEIVLSAESKRRFTADELLAWRLNTQIYGRGAIGIDAAARLYFGKSASSVNLAEAAVLAGIAGEPALDPHEAPAAARARGADMLFALRDATLIDQEQFDRAAQATVVFRAPPAEDAGGTAAFIKIARRQAESILDRLGLPGAQLLARGGLRITTSLDLALQREAECRMAALLEEGRALDCEAADSLAMPVTPPADAALALIEVDSGRILSLVGAAAAFDHQPAVALLPFLYMDAFLRREVTPASMLFDLPRSYPGASSELIYAPANRDGLFRGPMSARDALAAWRLPPAIQVASAPGMAATLDMARALGLRWQGASRASLDLLERGGGISTLDAAYAYSVLAGMGFMRGPALDLGASASRGREPAAILKIEDRAGRLLWAYDAPASATAVVEPSLAYMVNDILADDAARQRVLGRTPRETEGQTALVIGGSADGRDHWTLAYSPDFALAVHIGVAETSLEADSNEALWLGLLDVARQERDQPPLAWTAPADIDEYLVCQISGMLPPTTDHCPTRREIVPAGARLLPDDRWRTVEIDLATGQLATASAPDELRQRKAFFIPPDEAMDWWLENGMPLPPSSYSAESGDPRQAARLTAPADFAYAGATTPVAGTIEVDGATDWQLEYGVDVNPERWQAITEPRPVPADGAIAWTWETALFSGIHTLRLTVRFDDGSSASDAKLLTFDNTPPAVQLRAGDSPMRHPAQSAVALQAEVSDNLAIALVEFWLGETLLAEDRDWPYAYEHELEGPGELEFKAAAYDQVGNRAESTLRLEVLAG